MNPTTAVLATLLLCALSAAVGFLLGLEVPRRRRQQPLPLRRDSRPLPARRTLAEETSARLRSDIDTRVQGLRRARENAQAWQAPVIDQVAARSAPHFFADTTVEGPAAH